MKLKEVLYFAYGSNLSIAQITERLGYLGDIIPVKSFKLRGFKLVFNAGRYWGNNTYANIVEGIKTDYVEGMLYKITPTQFNRLDHYEGLYERYFFDVDADTIGCAYIATQDDNLVDVTRYRNTNPGYPTANYLQICMRGCRNHNLYELEQQFRNVLLDLPVTGNISKKEERKLNSDTSEEYVNKMRDYYEKMGFNDANF